MDLENFEELAPPSSPPPLPPPPLEVTKTRRVRKPKPPPEEELDDDETKRRRDILAQAIIMECLTGVTVKSVRTMKKKELDTLYDDYSLQLSKKMALKVLDKGASALTMLLDRFLGLDDPDTFRSSIVQNEAVRRTIGMHCAHVTERYGDVVEWLNLSFDLFQQTRKKADDTSSKEVEGAANDGRGEDNQGSS